MKKAIETFVKGLIGNKVNLFYQISYLPGRDDLPSMNQQSDSKDFKIIATNDFKILNNYPTVVRIDNKIIDTYTEQVTQKMLNNKDKRTTYQELFNNHEITVWATECHYFKNSFDGNPEIITKLVSNKDTVTV